MNFDSMLLRSIIIEHVWNLYECCFWFDKFFDVDGGPNLCENFGHNRHIYVNFQLYFPLHMAIPKQLALYGSLI